MSTQSRPSTDVKHSIAGFYYQLLIACNELVAIATDFPQGYVGVEYGADIRVKTDNDNYIEAKFYKNEDFSRYSEAIRHTIYNFYHTFRENKAESSFNIGTNVPISKSDIDFFAEWEKKNFETPEDYIHYVKNCLVYEYIDKKEFKEKLEAFKKTYDEQHTNQIRPQYKSALIKQLKLNPEAYREYIPNDILIPDDEILDFIKQVSFIFPPKKLKKYDSIINLKKETEQKLLNLYPGLQPYQYDNIRYLIMNSFLDTTVDESKHVVYVKDLETIFVSHEEATKQLFDNDSLAKTIIEIERGLIKYENKLIRQGHSDQMASILNVIGTCTEQWIQEAQIYGLQKVNNRYLMGAELPYSLNVLDLFTAMGEIYSSAEQDLGEIQLTDLQGINNLSFTDYKEFSIKTSPFSNDKEDEIAIITAFIEHGLKEQEYIHALGNETIILDTQCDICKFDTKNIEENIVIDIARPFGSIVQQGLYQAFDYRCIQCLKLDSNNTNCSFANNFKKGI